MTLQLIEQAIVLGDAGNFARAAERLGISQPTLSRNVAALESRLGCKLFDRGRSGAVPTVFGRAVIERGAALVSDANALRAELRALAGLESGRLDLAAGPYVAEDLVGPAVARLLNEHPRLQVRVTVVAPDQVGPEVLSGRHDLGLAGAEIQASHDALTIVPLRKRRLYIACRAGHPLLACRPTVEQVTGFPFVSVLMRGEAARAARTGGGAGSDDALRKGFVPAIEVNSLDTAKRIARHSDALFPGSAAMLATELSSGQLFTLDFDVPALRTRPALVQLRNRTLSPAALRFVELVREVEAELVAAEANEPGAG